MGERHSFEIESNIFSKQGAELRPFYYDELSMRIIQHISEAIEFSDIILEAEIKQNIGERDNIFLLDRLPRCENISELLKGTVLIKTDAGHGTGFIIRSDGLVLTNYPVVGQEVKSITMVDYEGKEFDCKIVAKNESLDMVLLQVINPDEDGFSAVFLDFDEKVSVGKEIFAVGAPVKASLANTVTGGIVTRKKTVDGVSYIQFDASVNPGNSGGPLVDKEGNVIGIVTAKQIGVGTEGFGYAIPIGAVRDVLKLETKDE